MDRQDCTDNQGAISRVFTIRQLLIDKQSGRGRLRIPAYQRNYTWNSENVRELCQDLLTARRNGYSEYHLGTLIFHRNGECWDVVDGQQRLTTIKMMFDYAGIQTVELDNPTLSRQSNTFSWNEISLWKNQGTRGKILEMLPNCTVVCIIVDDIAEAFQLFSTQNGRGKELTPVNLLKAYHFHDIQVAGRAATSQMTSTGDVFDIEAAWEHENSLLTIRNEQLLTEVLAEHLFRLRKWCLGDFIKEFFSNQYLGEFKGITLNRGEETLPLLNAALLRRLFKCHYQTQGLALQGLGNRLGTHHQDPDDMDPFASVTQSIINGEDFFSYASTFVTEYQILFFTYEKRDGKLQEISLKCHDEIPELKQFRRFYERHCLNYSGSKRVGDSYARHVFESLCILLFDRFGIAGLTAHHVDLYRFAYVERYQNQRLFYQTAGQQYALKCCAAILSCETLEELDKTLEPLSLAVISHLQDQEPKDMKCFSQDDELGKKRCAIMVGQEILH